MSERERDKSDRTTTEELSGDEGEQTIAKDIVVTKYNMAADIVNAVLKELISKCNADQSALELCDYGDQQLNERTSKVEIQKIDHFIKFAASFSFYKFICG